MKMASSHIGPPPSSTPTGVGIASPCSSNHTKSFDDCTHSVRLYPQSGKDCGHNGEIKRGWVGEVAGADTGGVARAVKGTRGRGWGNGVRGCEGFDSRVFAARVLQTGGSSGVAGEPEGDRAGSGPGGVGRVASSGVQVPDVPAGQRVGWKVFVCHVPSAERREWFKECVAAWVAGCRVLSPPPGVRPREFQRFRRIVADAQGGEFYVVADDDCLPVGEVLERGFEILRGHPEFTILSLWPENESIVEWTPDGCPKCGNREKFTCKGYITIPDMVQCGVCYAEYRAKDGSYQTANNAEVMEHVSVGGVRFCRRMPFEVWPEMPAGEYRGYDAAQCEAIRRCGKRVGYFRDLKMVHLGKGATTLL